MSWQCFEGFLGAKVLVWSIMLSFVHFWLLLCPHLCIWSPHDLKLSEKVLSVEKEYTCGVGTTVLVAVLQRALYQKSFKKRFVLVNFGHFLPPNFGKRRADGLKCSGNLACAQLSTGWASHNFFTCSTPLKGRFS